MQGQSEILELLNEILTGELTAINQYYVHARICENWGYERLWQKIRAEAIEEMKHADLLIERILFLGGVPNLQRLAKVNIGETVPEQLELDLEVERGTVVRLNDAVAVCRQKGDNGSRIMLEGILTDSEGHIHWIEAQLDQIRQVGAENYLAQQMKG